MILIVECLWKENNGGYDLLSTSSCNTCPVLSEGWKQNSPDNLRFLISAKQNELFWKGDWRVKLGRTNW